MYLKSLCSLLFFPIPLQSLVLTMDVPTPAVPLAWWDTAVLPAQCPAPTSAVGRPVNPQHPASQVSQSSEAQEEIWTFYFEMNREISTVNNDISPSLFFSQPCLYFQAAGVQRVRWWATTSSVCYQRSVCVRWQVCATGRASRWRWTVRFVFVREEGLRAASLIQTAPVSLSNTQNLLFHFKINIKIRGDFFHPHSRRHSSSALMFEQSYTFNFVFL